MRSTEQYVRSIAGNRKFYPMMPCKDPCFFLCVISVLGETIKNAKKTYVLIHNAGRQLVDFVRDIEFVL